MIVRRERERFSNELTLAYASGETAITAAIASAVQIWEASGKRCAITRG
jgi:hypothetical protein